MRASRRRSHEWWRVEIVKAAVDRARALSEAEHAHVVRLKAPSSSGPPAETDERVKVPVTTVLAYRPVGVPVQATPHVVEEDPPAPLPAVSPWEDVEAHRAQLRREYGESLDRRGALEHRLDAAVDRARALTEQQHQQEIKSLQVIIKEWLAADAEWQRERGRRELALTEARAEIARLTALIDKPEP